MRKKEERRMEEEEEEDEEDESEEKGDSDGMEHGEDDGAVRQVDGSGHRPFILPLIWTVNDFYLTMSMKVFNTLADHYQIPEHIPLRLPRKFEKCYSGQMEDVDMYDALFTISLRLLLTKLHH